MNAPIKIPVANMLNDMPTIRLLVLSSIKEGKTQLKIKNAQPTNNEMSIIFMFKN
jgi:hypothetical protein